MTEHDDKLIRELVAARAEAMTERDAEALAAQCVPGLLAYTLAPPLAHHGEDVESRKAWFASFDGPIEYEVRDLEVVVGGDVAYSHSLNRLSTTPKGMPRKFELWFRSTTGFRRENGEWRIAHVHDSTPFYMDGTMSAALDLKP
ncbi:nuclear transport factor 2 family protein [Amycolatopsis sp. FBCC-B4732]|uniref:YybH family protein n=1 Tax=Amycolatopsis sp. FBCC-B4732 TaxID=3079339 RepID=UPI001FF2494B|nr:nuclear transport factor 2 family protein [Amycolatopsis sp. FBCC-B4732]UOX87692.1 nuclear transport factor 2 family protein [Amycolatopsis sp. FBCC-B4732]